jgi:amidase
MGVGSDIGGSIRAPSLSCGAFGFKPTANRIPWAKQQELIPKGWPCIIPTLGPHTQSARDLTLFFKTVLEGKPWLRDSTALAIPWRNVPKKVKLSIGVMLTDNIMPVHPPVARILAAAVEKLKAAGHEVKVITNPPSVFNAAMLAARSFALDTEHGIQKFVTDGDEELIPEVSFDRPPGPNGGPPREVNLAEVWSINADLEDYREQWAKLWRDETLDVLICPGARGTAVPHGQYGIPLYTLVWNLLDVSFYNMIRSIRCISKIE